MEFGFLPVGHTHEDIDQLFSCISRQLKHRNALTVPGMYIICVHMNCCLCVCTAELTAAIENSFSPQPTVIVLDSVTEAKKWMSEQTPSIHDHLKAHLFKFERNEVGECRMFFKEWSTDLFWLPQTGLAFLPSNNAVPKHIPLATFEPILRSRLSEETRGYSEESRCIFRQGWCI